MSFQPTREGTAKGYSISFKASGLDVTFTAIGEKEAPKTVMGCRWGTCAYDETRFSFTMTPILPMD